MGVMQMENPVAAEKETTLELKPKMKFTGTVMKTTLAGAVVDIGVGKPAVIHVSQIESPDNLPIKSVKDVLKEGQTIEVWIRRIKEERIELTMFKPLDLEWRDIKKDLVVKGKVVRIEPFGVFLEIGAERPGLIHISELAHGFVRTPGDIVKEGDELEAQVIDLNKKKKQIKLSIKALQPEPVHETPEPKDEEKKDRPRRRKGDRRKKGEEGSFNNFSGMGGEAEQAEPDPTAMEIAIREAMEKAKVRKEESKVKKAKSISSEQDDLLTRTLGQKQNSK
jgi:small subunit ribosomal protein S1